MSQSWLRYCGAMACALVLLGTGACRRVPEVQAPDMGVPVVNPDTSGRVSLPAFEERIAARQARQDTAVIPHERLQAMFVDEIAGYTLDINEAATYHAPLFTFAEASKVFYNAEQDYIEFTAGDYVGNPDFFRVNMQRYNLALGVEISGVQDEKRLDEALRPRGAEQFFAWATYNSRKHVAWVFIGVNDRYFVTIEATGQQDFIANELVAKWVSWGGVLSGGLSGLRIEN